MLPGRCKKMASWDRDNCDLKNGRCVKKSSTAKKTVKKMVKKGKTVHPKKLKAVGVRVTKLPENHLLKKSLENHPLKKLPENHLLKKLPENHLLKKSLENHPLKKENHLLKKLLEKQ